ncbi:MAG: SUMF1/EgtB/PvdO family nonheme iron enzyme [Magnetococcales bacterium]|nr:SUMF1/EgtB/PvdO family nonheme iron enzyme [Magnetococcales bacterium]
MKNKIACTVTLWILCTTLGSTTAQAAAPTVANPIRDQTWSGRGAKNFRFPINAFADADGDTLSYSARLETGASLPSWLHFSPTTRGLFGNPPAGLASLNLRITANDGHGGQVSDTFRLSFSATNDAPVAIADQVTTGRNQTVTDTLTATDADGDRLTFRITRNATKGTATITNIQTGAFTYLPNDDVTGTDTFAFKVNDGHVDSTAATFTVTIQNPNAPPIAEDGILNVNQGTSTAGRLNATDPNGNPLTYRIVTNGSKGNVVLTNPATGAFTYTANANNTGVDSFTFRVNDGTSDSGTATVMVMISASFTNRLRMNFVRIPAGSFRMGSPANEPGRYFDELAHRVTIPRAFYMQTTEVTQGQWQTVMDDNPSYYANCGGSCPVERVSWEDIQTFLSRLNSFGEGYYRLPTEAEWEYAARAGTTTAYSFGSNSNNIGDYAWCWADSYGTHPVSQKLPNPWGLYDMHGNVLEWVSDAYGLFSSEDAIDPQGNSSSTQRVIRGGSWFSDPTDLRSSFRFNRGSAYKNYDLGFRLVLTNP